MVCCGKHAHDLLGVGDKVGGIAQMEACGSYWNPGHNKQETWILNLLDTEDQWVPILVVMVFLLYSQHQKSKRKFWKLGEELYGWISKAAYGLEPQVGDIWWIIKISSMQLMDYLSIVCWTTISGTTTFIILDHLIQNEFIYFYTH